MTLDVRVRLAEGAGAVAGQPQPIQEWYYAEDGLRLDVLDSDSAALAAAAVNSEEAVRVQREALDALTAGWHGGSGSSAVDFLARHCETAGGVVAALRDGAAALNALGEKLRNVVDAKVDAALSGDWVPSRSRDDATTAYDTAVTRLGELPVPRFETPLAPTPPAFDPMASDPSRPAPALSSVPLPPQQAAPGWDSGLSTAGLPNLGGSLAGLINQIAQALGSYSDTPQSDTPQSDTPQSDAAPRPTNDSVADVKPVVPEQQSAVEAPLAAE
ncbi:MAG: hypothetical protein WCK99_09850, partial [Mycobacteriaceae bacterium]